jgi:uncharacterized protein (DUF2062 family)
MFRTRRKRGTGERIRQFVWPRSGFRRSALYCWHRLRRLSATPHSIALGLATGVFMGFNPLIGLHIIVSAIICTVIGGSILAAAIGTFVCNPLMCPLMMIGNFKVGSFLLDGGSSEIPFEAPRLDWSLLLTEPSGFLEAVWSSIEPIFMPLLLGSSVLGLMAAVPVYFAARAAIESHRQRRSERFKSRVNAERA